METGGACTDRWRAGGVGLGRLRIVMMGVEFVAVIVSFRTAISVNAAERRTVLQRVPPSPLTTTEK